MGRSKNLWISLAQDRDSHDEMVEDTRRLVAQSNETPTQPGV